MHWHTFIAFDYILSEWNYLRKLVKGQFIYLSR